MVGMGSRHGCMHEATTTFQDRGRDAFANVIVTTEETLVRYGGSKVGLWPAKPRARRRSFRESDNFSEAVAATGWLPVSTYGLSRTPHCQRAPGHSDILDRPTARVFVEIEHGQIDKVPRGTGQLPEHCDGI